MAIMFPLIMTAATFPSFQHTYPFFRVPEGISIWPNIIIWEIFYLLQFLGTEFFFRGFLIHGLKARFGFYSIFVSMIPYCMIHFQKPFLEAFGSIFAGLILGTMSLRTNSIIMGVILHFGVALTMDICSLLIR
ncbi:MAG: CPBP family intramembrane metalloprotease [Candidatus Paracaedibacteraceae bacterium]|nr:CPBP family intramembrane metalloprotease [Candidatus Paracaedibacteraceae bacterium]